MRSKVQGWGSKYEGRVGGTLDARASPTRTDGPLVPCRADEGAPTVALGFLRSRPSRSQSHRTSTTVVVRPAPTLTAALHAPDTSFQMALQGGLSRPLLMARGSSLLAIPTLGTPTRPYLDGFQPVLLNHHARFAPTRMDTLSAGQSVSGGIHEKRDLYALYLSTVRVRCTGNRLYKCT